MNMVIAGDYKNAGINVGAKHLVICHGFKRMKLKKDMVESYELITDEHRKSAASGIGKGLVGGALLGPIGMLGGALSAKDKGKYQVAIQFKDGKRSLLELDNAGYNLLIKSLF